jgi:hypothetical protein
MRGSKLPQDLIELGHKYGLAGRRIYFPKQKLHTLVARYLPELLREIEATYEERGITFYVEASPRKVFSRMFGKSRVAFKFNLKLRTAASCASAAHKAWREWFSRSERPRLEQVRMVAQNTGRDYAPLYFSYLEMRNRLRTNQKVTPDDYTGFHSLPAEAVQQMMALAKSSIESCPWRMSQVS